MGAAAFGCTSGPSWAGKPETSYLVPDSNERVAWRSSRISKKYDFELSLQALVRMYPEGVLDAACLQRLVDRRLGRRWPRCWDGSARRGTSASHWNLARRVPEAKAIGVGPDYRRNRGAILASLSIPSCGVTRAAEPAVSSSAPAAAVSGRMCYSATTPRRGSPASPTRLHVTHDSKSCPHRPTAHRLPRAYRCSRERA